MIALIQRVTSAKVEVAEAVIAEITQGLLLFLGIEKSDNQEIADKLLGKVLSYRVFADANDKMNLSVKDINGSILVVSQFTLAADTDRGLRPSFSNAKPPAEAEQLYNYFLKQAELQYSEIAFGKFAADMKVSLVNDGPVTFILRT